MDSKVYINILKRILFLAEKMSWVCSFIFMQTNNKKIVFFRELDDMIASYLETLAQSTGFSSIEHFRKHIYTNKHFFGMHKRFVREALQHDYEVTENKLKL